MLSPPRYATPRRPDRPTTGAHVALVAQLLGVELQPWQRHAADLAGELVPDPDTGELVHAYGVVTLGVGRRAGKSLLTLARLIATVIANRRSFTYYAAQNGKAGAERFRNDWTPLVQAAPPILSQRLHPRLTNGTETLTDRGAGSYLRIFAPIPTALHGDAADLIAFDEAWAHGRERGRDLEVAAFPLMATRLGAQLWIMSAAGDLDSTWWTDWLDAGRDAAAADTGRGHCHVEWTAEGTDPDTWSDPDTWIAAHPGIRHPGNPGGVVSLDYLRMEHDRDPDQFARAYLNVTDRAGTVAAPIDADQWSALATDPPDRATVTLGVDVAPDQTSAAIMAAHVTPDGSTVLETVDVRSGIDWCTARLVELYDRWTPAAIALDGGGQSPAAVLVRPLQAHGVPVRDLNLSDVCSAAADLVSAVRGGRVRHVPHPALDAAVKGARRRPVGDGAWLWQRRDAGVDVSPLIAATYARWVHPDVHSPTGAAIR